MQLALSGEVADAVVGEFVPVAVAFAGAEGVFAVGVFQLVEVVVVEQLDHRACRQGGVGRGADGVLGFEDVADQVIAVGDVLDDSPFRGGGDEAVEASGFVVIAVAGADAVAVGDLPSLAEFVIKEDRGVTH